MAKQQFNRRLSDEAIAAINWWAKADSTPARKVTDTEIVERAIAYYDEMRAQGGEIHIPDAPQGLGGRQMWDAPIMPSRPSQGQITNISAAPPSFPFTRQCKHCGEDFGTANKFASICVTCKHSGHSNDPRDCPVCGDRGAGGL